jgi:putative ABC transport system permease protein
MRSLLLQVAAVTMINIKSNPAAVLALSVDRDLDRAAPAPGEPGGARGADQSSLTSDLIQKLGWPLAIAMALGALAGALNTMYSSVAARASEIATLRAIGFGGFSAFVGTIVESLILAAIGGLIGALVAFLFFDGLTTSTLGASFTQVVFSFRLSPMLIVQGVLLALVVGAIGGLFPALRAARMPIVAGLSE